MVVESWCQALALRIEDTLVKGVAISLDEGVDTSLVRGRRNISWWHVLGSLSEKGWSVPNVAGILLLRKRNGFKFARAGSVAKSLARGHKENSKDNIPVHCDQIWMVFQVSKTTRHVIVDQVYFVMWVADSDISSPG